MTIIIIYLLFLAVHLYVLKKIARGEVRGKARSETKDKKKRYSTGVLSIHLLLFVFSLILIYALLEIAVNWAIAPRVTQLKKSDEKTILINDEKRYTDLAYDTNGNLHGIYWDEKELTFFTEMIFSAEKNNTSTGTPIKLEETPFIFSDTSSFTQLPLSKKLANGKIISLRAIWVREDKNTISQKIKLIQKDPESGEEIQKILPTKLKEESLLSYTITDDGFLLSYIPSGEIFNQIFIYQDNLEPSPLSDDSLKKHSYAPYYFEALKSVFYIDVVRQNENEKKNGFISKLVLKKLTGNREIILEKPLVASKILQTHVTKVAGSHDGHFFVYHAIDEANILLFTWMEKLNFSFLLQWKDLEKIFSLSLSQVKNELDNSYQLAVLGLDKSDKQNVIISKLKPTVTSSFKTSAANFYFALILGFFGISLYAASLLILKRSIRKNEVPLS